ncbi:uncharacterized protein CANTADRAFT_293646 [Suhomyces tanzawaensis NRRL Y-17324]|uniref:Uncharacterized protein n=1 Tax=Suhomyces tanzawaensis NRRL Y-17324 TaxID=984487 RepID=A0A1E4SEV1_9ASCO|nr:uncharacterized protein CANTADRAFT_293646 [Suhomyces tanzawaensis NRRL Y-17324]ODV78018.1 hypothetical protein CANTADRAFT_293646 [Suhomyces tanzawaensis NRRL Y-17324]
MRCGCLTEGGSGGGASCDGQSTLVHWTACTPRRWWRFGRFLLPSKPSCHVTPGDSRNYTSCPTKIVSGGDVISNRTASDLSLVATQWQCGGNAVAAAHCVGLEDISTNAAGKIACNSGRKGQIRSLIFSAQLKTIQLSTGN